MKIAVIGSGLAAVSAAQALIQRGIKPIILDVGRALDSNVASIVETMSGQIPEQWSTEHRNLIADNPTVYNKATFPLKLAFGSDYFYGRSSLECPLLGEGNLPPFSYAKGGLSVGWGASVLPADDADLVDWPVSSINLQKYYSKVLTDKPYSAVDDDLSANFPLMSHRFDPIKLTPGIITLLADLRRSNVFSKNNLVFGQSRALVQSAENGNLRGCRYCGLCMSGCAYGSIYKASHTIDELVSSGKIEYRNGLTVKSLQDGPNSVKVLGVTQTGENFELIFDKVFLAAGALNSTRIILQSKKLYDQAIVLKSTASFIAPMLRIKRSPLIPLNSSTLPGIFLEYKTKNLSDHWIHCQMSTPNEMVLQRIGYNIEQNRISNGIKKFVAEHIILALGNMHSAHGNGYELRLTKGSAGESDTLVFSRQNGQLSRLAIKKAVHKLFRIGLKIGCYPLLPFAQDSTLSGGYHVGGSLPMKTVPLQETDTDIYGTPKGWRHVHVVDSSIFPSIPGTTIGLLAMANASRIASEIPLP